MDTALESAPSFPGTYPGSNSSQMVIAGIGRSKGLLKVVDLDA